MDDENISDLKMCHNNAVSKFINLRKRPWRYY